MNLIFKNVVVVIAICVPQLANAAPQLSSRVPTGQTYTIFSKDRTQIGTFRSGQAAPLTRDCVKVDCPSGFAGDTVCWECRRNDEAKDPGRQKKKQKK